MEKAISDSGKNRPTYKEIKLNKSFLEEEHYKRALQNFSVGFTKVSNELIYSALNSKLSLNELKCLMIIARFTNGYNKQKHGISLSYFSALMGKTYNSSLSKAIGNLVKNGFVQKNKGRYYSINEFSLTEKSLKISKFKLSTSADFTSKNNIDMLRNGTTSINNSLLLKALNTDVVQSEFKMILAMTRFTLGFQRENSTISKGILRAFTGMNYKSFNKSISLLQNEEFFTVDSDTKMKVLKVSPLKEFREYIINVEYKKPVEVRETLTNQSITKKKENKSNLYSLPKSRLEKEWGTDLVKKAYDYVKSNIKSSNGERVKYPYSYLDRENTMATIIKKVNNKDKVDFIKKNPKKNISKKIFQKNLLHKEVKTEDDKGKRVDCYISVLTEEEKLKLRPDLSQNLEGFNNILTSGIVQASIFRNPLFSAILSGSICEEDLRKRLLMKAVIQKEKSVKTIKSNQKDSIFKKEILNLNEKLLVS